MDKEKEIWLPVPQYENYYKVSNHGRIWSLRRDKAMVFSIDRGYLKVGLSDGFNRKTFRVHRLVGLMFVDNPDNKPEINHDDFDKSNNYYKNLKWATGEENREHYSNSLGLNEKCKPVLQKCLCGHLVKRYDSISDASRVTGLSSDTISACVRGKTKTSGGYNWCYEV